MEHAILERPAGGGPATRVDGGGPAFASSLVIARPPAEVLATLADPALLPRWAIGVFEVRGPAAGGAARAGTRFEIGVARIGSVAGRPSFTRSLAPRYLGATAACGPERVVRSYRPAAAGGAGGRTVVYHLVEVERGTALTCTVHLDLPAARRDGPWPATPLLEDAARGGERSLARSLHHLRRAVESPARRAARGMAALRDTDYLPQPL